MNNASTETVQTPSPNTASVTAVIVTHNSATHLRQCLTALAPAVDEVVVVDNASQDESREIVRQAAPDARLIALDANVGFGAANNVAMRSSKSRYFLLVNPDAWPLGDAVRTLLTCARRDLETGIVGPTLVHADGSVQRSVYGYPHNALLLSMFAAFPALVRGPYVGWRHAVMPIRRARAAPESLIQLRKRDFLSGAALLVSARAVADVGGFDERLFFLNEDADLCFRVREAGWSVASCPGARFVHIGGASSPASQEWRYGELVRSHLLLFAKRRGPARAERTRRLLVALLLARAALTPGRARRRVRYAAARLRAPDALSPMG